MRSLLDSLWIVGLSVAACGRVGYDVLPIEITEDGGRDAASPTDGGGRDSGGLDSGSLDATVPTDATVTVPDAAVDAALPPCEEDPCKLVLPQCGCPHGEACQRTVRGEATRECVAPGELHGGQGCTQSIQCVTGYTCVGFSGDGVCSRYCTATAECPAASECVLFAQANDGVGACTPVCDPVQNSGCPADLGCHLLTAGRVEDEAAATVTVCGPDTGGVTGEVCELTCAPGFICGGAVCSELCVVGDASTCSVGVSCGSFEPRMAVGLVEYGFCQ